MMAGRGRERSGVKSDIPILSIKVDGVAITIDQRTLTMGERQRVKGALAKLDYPADDMDALTATIWVVMRRTDPTLTFADVCDSLTLGDLSDAEASDVDEASPEG